MKPMTRLQAGCHNGQIKYGAASTKRICAIALKKATEFDIAVTPELDIENKFKVYPL